MSNIKSAIKRNIDLGTAKKGIFAHLLFIPVLLILITLFEFSYHRFMPVGHFVQYRSVTSEKEILKPNDHLTMISDRWVKGNTWLYFDDILFCDMNGNNKNFVHVSQMRSNRYYPREADGAVKWIYTSNIPKDKKCFVHSTITVKGKYGVNKSLTKTSNTFHT